MCVLVCFSSYFCSPSAEKDTVLRSRDGEEGVEDGEQLSEVQNRGGGAGKAVNKAVN